MAQLTFFEIKMNDPFKHCRNRLITLNPKAETPSKKINEENFPEFKDSEAYYRIMDFITTMNQSILVGNQEPIVPDQVQQIIDVLDQIEQIAIDIVPQFETSRFGSLTFREFISTIEYRVEEIHETLMPRNVYKKEIMVYLQNSFGDKTRLDYGSGHELNFICWLLCLYLTGFFETNYSHFKLLFNRYLKLMRVIQIRYRLEPAGSHGVWVTCIYRALMITNSYYFTLVVLN